MATESLPYLLPRVGDEELEFRKYLNFLLTLADRRRNSETVAGRPFEVTIDPSTICQLSCPYCELGNGTIRRGRAVLDPDLHEKMLDQLGPGVFIAWYFSTGEPLLNKRLAEVIGRTRGRGIFTIISTNLSLPLSDERVDDLLQCGLGIICVSLDGASPETYGRYRIGGDFSLVVENMQRLVRRKARLGLEYPLIEWRFLVFRHNQHEIDRARQLASEYGVDLLEFFPGFAPEDATEHEVQRAIEPAFAPAASGPALDAARRRGDAALIAHLRNRPMFDRPPPPEHMRHQKCDWLYCGGMLFPSGSVSPCCVSNNEPDDFGVITAGISFSEVWNNGNFRQARRTFVRDEPNALICSRCPNRDAQDYQFRTTIRAVLRNAPEWVLKILLRDPKRFFFDIDFELSPVELGALCDGSLRIPGTFAETVRRLEREASASGTAREEIVALRKLLVTDDPVACTAPVRERSASAWKRLCARFRNAFRPERPS